MKKFTIPGKVRQLNATIIAPENAGLRIVLNACAQSGKFDSPLEALLTKRWAKVREDYKGWHATQFNFKPGSLNNTAVASDTWVVNMLVKDKDGNLNSDALKLAVKKLAEQVKSERGSSVHVSTMLLEDAPQLQDLLMSSLVEEGINVYYYKEPERA
jgi:hypothetical protein